jgi:hypothetical protein
MNGRVYDYRLGRFLSVDPIISKPLSSQAINPYSYIGNNPLSGTDPTGYQERSICDGNGGASNCSRGGLDPNETVGMKWTTTWKNADGSTGTNARIEMYGNGAPGQGTMPTTTDTTRVGSSGENNRGNSNDASNALARRWLDQNELAKQRFANTMPQCQGDECRHNLANGLMLAGLLWTPAFIGGAALEFSLTGDPTALVLAGTIPVGGKLLEELGAGLKFIDPTRLRFTQDSIKSTFSSGGTIEELAAGLRSGAVRASDIPAVRLVERDGLLYTLDNRRLEAFRRAGVEIPYRMATPEEVAREAWKFTTRNAGETIRVRSP